jgi:hypothetical protein
MLTNVSGVILPPMKRPDDGGSMTSETLVNIDQTTHRNNPEDGNLEIFYCLRNEVLGLYNKIIIFMISKTLTIQSRVF